MRLSVFAAVLAASLVWAPARAQLAPPGNGGAAELDRLLQKVTEPRRVLIVGAHPDDEDTALLALLARGYGADAAYLSLSRGEGGQNLVGSELGVGLGLIRSRELLAAREIDGARQFFTRAYDFGYTRSLEETLSLWHPDSLLKDAVRVVRKFRPHVIVSVFSGTPRDGHGQHQAAGVTAARAFETAGDPSVFPELGLEEGLEPWEPAKFYRSTRFDTAATTVSLPTGSLDPRTGRSYYQVAMESRSQHRSQDMGRLQYAGPQFSRVALLEDRTGGADGDNEEGLFGGIHEGRTSIEREAARVRALVRTSDLSQALGPLVALHRLAETEGAPDLTQRRIESALAIAAGVVVDAVADRAQVMPGQPVVVTATVYNSGPSDIVVESVTAHTAMDWERANTAGLLDGIEPGSAGDFSLTVTPPENSRATQPYFLEHPLTGYLYDWSHADPATRGEPFQEPTVMVEFVIQISGVRVRLQREASHRTLDQAFGEIRQEIRVVPRVDVALSPASVVWPSEGAAVRQFDVAIAYNGQGAYSGDIALSVDGWPATSAQRFRFENNGESEVFIFDLNLPESVREGGLTVRAQAIGDDGVRYSEGVRLVEYPHFRPTPWVESATASLVIAPIDFPDIGRIGYVRGASDRVPEALAAIGVDVEILDPEMLAEGDLSVFDVIVVGSRAYEIDPALARYNDRVLQFAEQGGHLVVQYQQYQFVRGEYAPFPLSIARPHDRVTDETAPINILVPDHPLFNYPNHIGEADWLDWPQERGLYFASTWDDRYRPLLEMHDEGLPELRGGLLLASYGRGSYIYTGISFFRALPAGNLGAFRLFLNVLGFKGEQLQ